MHTYFKGQETQKDKEISHQLEQCPATLDISTITRLGEVKARSLKLNPGLSKDGRNSIPWSHHLLPPKVFFSRELESGVEPELEPRH